MSHDVRVSSTTKVLVGCGNIYITRDYNPDGSLHKVYMQRTNKLHCSPTVLNSLFRSCTYTSRRDIKQAIKDHRGTEVDACDKFNIQVKSCMKKGELCAYSCSDAISKVLELELKPATITEPKTQPVMKGLGDLGKL